ncbi:MAG: hypothetical protein LIP12_09335 [Clostridiales bacterium]|nr:hypothetical protein [Clostridiales bacterium]
MSKIKKVLCVLLAVTMLAGLTCTATVALAEEAVETEAVTEAAADVTEDTDTETESPFEWTLDTTLTFTDGIDTYQIYMYETQELVLCKLVDGAIEGSVRLLSPEDEEYDILYKCIEAIFVTIPENFKAKGIW